MCLLNKLPRCSAGPCLPLLASPQGYGVVRAAHVLAHPGAPDTGLSRRGEAHQGEGHWLLWLQAQAEVSDGSPKPPTKVMDTVSIWETRCTRATPSLRTWMFHWPCCCSEKAPQKNNSFSVAAAAPPFFPLSLPIR